MSAIPDGIRTESGRNPKEGGTDSGLNKPASQPASQEVPLGLGTSLRAGNHLQAAAMTVVGLRPDWTEADVYAVLARDSRPWRTVLGAALRCALDPDIRHPGAIETSNPDRASLGPTPTPPAIATWRTAPRCPHGAHEGACALCRRHVPADPEDAA
jgi:hypothetical protein